MILDASMATQGGVCIPSARHFDFDKKICKQTGDLPHMMPDAIEFQTHVQNLGINKDSLIVIYDSKGIYSAPRAWWMFRSMGHENVAVLDGGLPEWMLAGGKMQDGHSTGNRPGNFKAQDKHLFSNIGHVASALCESKSVVVDARSRERFHGKAPEPREGLRGGHMLNAINMPFTEVLQGNRMKSKAELIKIFSHVSKEREQFIFSCGSGVTACILALAADIAGIPHLSVYDGSWSEWGLPSDRVVVQS